jgi:hypothetical protein
MHRGRRWLTYLSTVLLFPAVSVWVIAFLGWGRYFVAQGPHAGYVLAVTRWHLIFQATSDISPDPERPATSRWQWFGGEVWLIDRTGCLEVSDPSPLSSMGLFRTVEQIPYSDGVTNGPNSFAHVGAFCRSFVLPWWVLIGCLAVLPLRRRIEKTREQIRQRRAAEGCCPRCGYDLRATPERCPECGTIPSELGARRPITLDYAQPRRRSTLGYAVLTGVCMFASMIAQLACWSGIAAAMSSYWPFAITTLALGVASLGSALVYKQVARGSGTTVLLCFGITATSTGCLPAISTLIQRTMF